MIVGFFDESYYKDSFWFGSVLAGPAELPQLLEELKQAKAESPAEHSYQELHGSEIFAGKGPWASSSIEERKFWYSRFLGCIAASGARVVAKGSDDPNGHLILRVLRAQLPATFGHNVIPVETLQCTPSVGIHLSASQSRNDRRNKLFSHPLRSYDHRQVCAQICITLRGCVHYC